MAVNIVSRAQWGALTPNHKDNLQYPAKRAIIHHTAMRNTKTLAESISELQIIQKGHMQNKHYDDIGYNFLVGEDGTVYEGRGWGVMGAHTKGHNKDSLGIAFMGNFTDESPSLKALTSVKQLLEAGVAQGFLLPEFLLFGHRDLGNTECPGAKLYSALPLLSSTR
ncbi:peptidoglycan recognition protein 5 [Boleophthalmus pectinirostris]|uniref:peptidoglycan recognition protein 5 n=1 Tax=Boleophthalmus pectinirostris TaxID=150288 RepID=UPI000A1C53C9|nr:peptidoglycan recognition protein 5 [Boleophthalmus pectinirostris]